MTCPNRFRGWLPPLLVALLVGAVGPTPPSNRVLVLDRTGDGVRLPSDLLKGVHEITLEAWVRWDGLGFFSEVFGFGHRSRGLFLGNRYKSSTLELYSYLSRDSVVLVQAEQIIRIGAWQHVAAVVTQDSMRLYLNGALVGASSAAGVLDSIGPDPENLVGISHWAENTGLHGRIDEISLWRVARTASEIRHDMGRRFTGHEPGLLGLWTFDGGGADGSGPHGFDGTLLGHAHTTPQDVPRDAARAPSLLSGTVRNEAGTPLPDALVAAHVGDHEPVETRSDSDGHYRFFVFSGALTLSASYNGLGTWRSVQNVLPGIERRVDLHLSPAVSISGRLQGLDGSPQPTVAVQAIHVGGPLAGATSEAFSDVAGVYRFVNLQPGDYRLRVLAGAQPVAGGRILHVGRPPTRATRVDFSFPTFRKGIWRTYSAIDGLFAQQLTILHATPDGALWIGSANEGLYRFDGRAFRRFTMKDGLASNVIVGVDGDGHGGLWVATPAGVSHEVHDTFTNLAPAAVGDHAAAVSAMTVGADGTPWLGLRNGTVLRCDENEDGRRVCTVVFDRPELRPISVLLSEPDGGLWAGGATLLHYDRHGITEHSPGDDNPVTALYRDAGGQLWIGTDMGLTRLGDAATRMLTTRDGLPDGPVRGIADAGEGWLWIATSTGVSRVDMAAWESHTGDGAPIATFSTFNGVPPGSIRDITVDHGALWVAGAELGRYDADEFVRYTTADGLPDNDVSALHRDEDGTIWVGTGDGLARLRHGVVTPVRPTEQLPHAAIVTMARPAGGDLWLSLGFRAIRFDGLHFTVQDRTQGLPSWVGVNALAPGPHDAPWVGARTGLFAFDGATFRPVLDHGATLSVHSLLRGGGDTLWIGTPTGVVRYDGKGFVPVPGTEGKRSVNALFRDADGTLWAGMQTGLARDDGHGLTAVDLHGYSGPIYAIARAPWGSLCVGTSIGLFLFNGTTWTTMDHRDGLGGDQVHALVADTDGSLWVGTEGGLTRYRLRADPPHIHFRSVQADRLYTDLDSLPPIHTGTRVTLSYDMTDLATRNGEQRYRRRIVDDRGRTVLGWQNSSQSGLDFTFHRPGRYTFQVAAVSPALESSPVRSLDLTVTDPWYAVLWLQLLAGMALVALVGTSVFNAQRYYRQRVETGRLREQMLEQERAARAETERAYREVQRLLGIEERTGVILRGWAHAVKSPLTMIRRQLGHQGADTDVAARVSRIVGTVDLLLGAVVDLQPRHFDLRSELNLLLYRIVRDHPGVAMRVGEGAVRVHADHGKLVMGFENLFVNACRAVDGDGTVSLEIEVRGDTARVTVSDDGPGIPDDVRERLFKRTVTTHKSSGGTGLGLLIAQHVIDAHGGRIWIEETSPAGTVICVDLPRSEE